MPQSSWKGALKEQVAIAPNTVAQAQHEDVVESSMGMLETFWKGDPLSKI